MIENIETFRDYDLKAKSTDSYPKQSTTLLHALGLTGEAGEVADKIKKVFRDKNGIFSDEDKKSIIKELGDTLWYLSRLCEDMDENLEICASINITKLKSRYERGKIAGAGDER